MIKLDDNYVLDADNTSFVLSKKRVPKEGKNAGNEMYSAVSWHGTVTQALNAWSRMRIRDAVENVDGDLMTLVATIREAEAEIERLINEAGRGL